MSSELDNVAPTVYTKAEARVYTEKELDNSVCDEIDAREIFDLIRDINDPEHPLSLEELNVVSEELIKINDKKNKLDVQFTPTIPHCSMATLIGLSIKVKLMRSLPSRFKIAVRIQPGSHSTEDAINKQLADKERVAAAMENASLVQVINQCLAEKEN